MIDICCEVSDLPVSNHAITYNNIIFEYVPSTAISFLDFTKRSTKQDEVTSTMAEEQSEETKAEAREFMVGMVGSAPDASNDGEGPKADMAAWKATYTSAADKSAALEELWAKHYNAGSTSLWTMVYDEADSNESLEQTVEFVKDFIQKAGTLGDHCFGVVHTLDGLEIEGIWFFNANDPEELFGAVEDSSWFTWSQLGPEPNDMVKNAAAKWLAPADTIDGKAIKDTQTS